MTDRLRLARLAALVGFAAVALSTTAAAQPRVVAENPIHDFGMVTVGEQLSHEFVLRNDGDAVLEIHEVTAACACTVVEFDSTIPPGGTGKVKAVLDTAPLNGPLVKTVRAFTNDPDTPSVVLSMRVEVRPAIAAVPGYARYIAVQGFEKKGLIAQTLWAMDGQDFEVVKVESPYPYLAAEFREARAQEEHPKGQGRQWRVETVLSPDSPVGALIGHLVIHTNHPQQKLLRIPVSGFVRPIFAVTPPVADLGEVELTEDFRTQLHVKNFADEEILLTNVENDVSGLETEISEHQEGRIYYIFVTLKSDMAKGPFRGKITIHTSSPKEPVVEVTVKGKIL